MRMINGSDTMPDVIVNSAGKTQIRYDIEESERVEMDGSKKTCYSYSYIAIDGEVTRDKIIDAIIKEETPPVVVETVEKPKPKVKEINSIDMEMVSDAIIQAKGNITKGK